MAIVAPGVTGSKHHEFVKAAFALYPSKWRICVFHKNQRLMQVGGKNDEAGWQIYEECRRQGAIVHSAHEHSYSRTLEMSSFENQMISSTNPSRVNLRVGDNGTSVCFVSGCAGEPIRDFEDGLENNPWWASALSSDR
jgi:hypothetical protein